MINEHTRIVTQLGPLIVALVALLGGTWILAQKDRDISDILDRMDLIEAAQAQQLNDNAELTLAIAKLNFGIDALNEKIVGDSGEGWHRYQQMIFCRRLEDKNDGVECPALEEIPAKLPD